MEDVLTIALLVLWGVFSLYRASRKKSQKAQKKARPQTTAAQPSESEFSTILSDLLGEKKESNTSQSPEMVFEEEKFRYEQEDEEVDLEPKKSDYFSFDDNLVDEEHDITNKLEKYYDEHKAEQNEVMEALSISEENHDNTIEEMLEGGFDLKKAVIYSEILNRRYH